MPRPFFPSFLLTAVPKTSSLPSVKNRGSLSFTVTLNRRLPNRSRFLSPPPPLEKKSTQRTPSKSVCVLNRTMHNNDAQHNDAQHNKHNNNAQQRCTTQHAQHNDAQHNNAQHNDAQQHTQHNMHNMHNDEQASNSPPLVVRNTGISNVSLNCALLPAPFFTRVSPYSKRRHWWASLGALGSNCSVTKGSDSPPNQSPSSREWRGVSYSRIVVREVVREVVRVVRVS